MTEAWLEWIGEARERRLILGTTDEERGRDVSTAGELDRSNGARRCSSGAATLVGGVDDLVEAVEQQEEPAVVDEAHQVIGRQVDLEAATEPVGNEVGKLGEGLQTLEFDKEWHRSCGVLEAGTRRFEVEVMKRCGLSAAIVSKQGNGGTGTLASRVAQMRDSGDRWLEWSARDLMNREVQIQVVATVVSLIQHYEIQTSIDGQQLVSQLLQRRDGDADGISNRCFGLRCEVASGYKNRPVSTPRALQVARNHYELFDLRLR